jgi:tRNA dimethylallyltransferase
LAPPALGGAETKQYRPHCHTRAPSTLRERLTAEAEELGAEGFHALLAARDPQSAALIHPHNVRRVVRAFELLEQGTSYAAQHEGFATFRSVYPTRLIGLAVEPKLLSQAIERRVDAMVAAGLLDEVRGLMERGFREAATAQQAIGYKELVPVVEGRCSLEEAAAQVKQATRRYAKRQRTWFRRDARIEWMDVSDLHRLVLEGALGPADFARRLQERALSKLVPS